MYEWARNNDKLQRAIGILLNEGKILTDELVKEKYISIAGAIRDVEETPVEKPKRKKK